MFPILIFLFPEFLGCSEGNDDCSCQANERGIGSAATAETWRVKSCPIVWRSKSHCIPHFLNYFSILSLYSLLITRAALSRLRYLQLNAFLSILLHRTNTNRWCLCFMFESTSFASQDNHLRFLKFMSTWPLVCSYHTKRLRRMSLQSLLIKCLEWGG